MVDGVGSARAVLQQEDQDVAPLLDGESKRAQQSAVRIRVAQADKDILGGGGDHHTNAGEQPGQALLVDDKDEEEKDAGDDSDFETPKSMREIYKISIRNRTKNKKMSSPQVFFSQL